MGGVDVTGDLEAIWANIGLVPQRPYLFSGTVASNLRYGSPEATDEELWDALWRLPRRDFVAAMPDGLGDGDRAGRHHGVRRPAPAALDRAGARPQAEVLVFDDSFSALDTTTDARLRGALASGADATVVVVAQRVSSIMDADQILVLEDGRIVARGTHKELLTSSETYKEIVSTQLRAEDAA